MKLNGTTVVITGATGRLGRRIALWLSGVGCSCVVHYHTKRDLADQLVEQMSAGGLRAMAVGGDLTRAGDIENLIEQAAAFGSLGGLVNSASVFEQQSLDQLDQMSIDKTLSTNLRAPLLLSRHFVEAVRQQNNNYSDAKIPLASIVNITDIAAQRPWAGYSAYCASRAGLVAVTQSLAKELAPQITVNAVAPGIVVWPGQMNPDQEQKQLEMIPQKRFGTPEDICKAVGFLIENDYITGQVLNVDGGRSL